MLHAFPKQFFISPKYLFNCVVNSVANVRVLFREQWVPLYLSCLFIDLCVHAADSQTEMLTSCGLRFLSSLWSQRNKASSSRESGASRITFTLSKSTVLDYIKLLRSLFIDMIHISSVHKLLCTFSFSWFGHSIAFLNSKSIVYNILDN